MLRRGNSWVGLWIKKERVVLLGLPFWKRKETTSAQRKALKAGMLEKVFSFLDNE